MGSNLPVPGVIHGDDGATLNLGAGYCHFITNVRSATRYAVDVNEENLVKYASSDVHVIKSSGNQLSVIADSSLDTVFASNLYEHFQMREEVLQSLKEVYRVLREPGAVHHSSAEFCVLFAAVF